MEQLQNVVDSATAESVVCVAAAYFGAVFGYYFLYVGAGVARVPSLILNWILPAIAATATLYVLFQWLVGDTRTGETAKKT